MNLGDCPYCNEFLGLFEVPEKAPCYSVVNCQACRKDVWYRHSRIDPMAWTVEDFEKEFTIDYENNKIERMILNEQKQHKSTALAHECDGL